VPAPALLPLVALIVGALLLFFGYRWFRFLLACAGFVLGLVIGLALVTEPLLLGWLAGLLLGLLGAALMGFFYLLGIFVLGAIATFLVAGAALQLFQLAAEDTVLIVMALVGGALAVALQKTVISGVTAAYGASQVILGLNGLGAFGRPAPATGSPWQPWLDAPSLPGEPWALGLWVALFLAGFLYQLRSRREHRPER